MARAWTWSAPEGVDGDGGHQGGVDAARQAHDGVDESVLGQIVPGPEDEGAVDLGVGVEGAAATAAPDASRRSRGAALTGTTASSAGRRAARRPGVVGRRHLDVDGENASR